MNMTDWIILAVVVILLIGALVYNRRHKGCDGDCTSCGTSCASAKPQTPAFVKAYRKDHPKNGGAAK